MVSDPSCPFPTQPGTKSQTFSRGPLFLLNAPMGYHTYRSYSTSLHNSLRASHEKIRWVHCLGRKSAKRLPNFLCCACAVQTTGYWKYVPLKPQVAKGDKRLGASSGCANTCQSREKGKDFYLPWQAAVGRQLETSVHSAHACTITTSACSYLNSFS